MLLLPPPPPPQTFVSLLGRFYTQLSISRLTTAMSPGAEIERKEEEQTRLVRAGNKITDSTARIVGVLREKLRAWDQEEGG